MLALQIEYLTGRVVATAFDDRDRAEWPPHPARLFSALVATWHECGGVADEEQALAWLEAQPPPDIVASGASQRDVVTCFVPVNDKTALSHGPVGTALAKLEQAEAALSLANSDKNRARAEARLHKARAKVTAASLKVTAAGKGSVDAAVPVLPGRRTRQARTFPSVTPEVATVEFQWAQQPSAELRGALDRLARRVSRLGHSSSLVSCRLVSGAQAERAWTPDRRGSELVRVPEPGQLERLRSAFEVHAGVEPRLLPARLVRYRRPVAAPAVRSELGRSVFEDEWLVFHRAAGPRLPLTRGVEAARHARRALLSFLDVEGPIPEPLAGHTTKGAASQHPHLAILPLPFVGHPHADGGLRGLALVLPRDSGVDVRHRLLRAVGRWEANNQAACPDADPPFVEVRMGRGGLLTLQRQLPGVRMLHSLREASWCRPSRRWVSATPVALDRNPGNLSATRPAEATAAWKAAEEIVRRACCRVGLPEPLKVSLGLQPPLSGSRPVWDFPPFPPNARRSKRPRRVRVHVRLCFETPVRGPVVLGAGRYLGQGLLRPVFEEQPCRP